MATSCESRRSSAYSDDLRWRMIYQKDCLGLPYYNIASNLQVDVSTVKRMVKIWRNTGTVSKKVYDKSSLPRKITGVVQFFILQSVLQNPGIYLSEIKAKLRHFKNRYW